MWSRYTHTAHRRVVKILDVGIFIYLWNDHFYIWNEDHKCFFDSRQLCIGPKVMRNENLDICR